MLKAYGNRSSRRSWSLAHGGGTVFHSGVLIALPVSAFNREGKIKVLILVTLVALDDLCDGQLMGDIFVQKTCGLLARACFCSKNTALNNIARTAILFVFYVNIQEELLVCNVETVQP